jgi:molybdenum cofactor cytidylyltransferase
MGQPKLLMPLDARPLIQHAIGAWLASKVERVIVVVRAEDLALADVVRAAGAEVAIPGEAPPDMKASIVCGLAHIAACYKPLAQDFWLVAPADMPGLSPEIIDRVIDRAVASPGSIVIPTIAGRRGHPVLLPWPLMGEIERLDEEEGLNTVIHRNVPLLVPSDDLAGAADRAFADVDTPGDLAAFSAAKPANTKPPPAN